MSVRAKQVHDAPPEPVPERPPRNNLVEREGGDDCSYRQDPSVTVDVWSSKVVAAFSKQFPLLKIKAGFVGAKWMTPSDCQKLSTLGSRPELLAKLAGTLYSAVAQSAGVLQAPIRDFVLVLAALEEKKKKEAGTAA